MRSIIASLLLVLGSSVALAGDEAHPVTLWRVAGEANSVYLLGSIHLLREQDLPLPSVIDDAYGDADIIVMELDMDDMDPVYAQAAFTRAGVRTDGTTLQDLMATKRTRKPRRSRRSSIFHWRCSRKANPGWPR